MTQLKKNLAPYLLSTESLKEALQNGYQHTDFDDAMRNFDNKESFDADIPRILNRKEIGD